MKAFKQDFSVTYQLWQINQSASLANFKFVRWVSTNSGLILELRCCIFLYVAFSEYILRFSSSFMYLFLLFDWFSIVRMLWELLRCNFVKHFSCNLIYLYFQDKKKLNQQIIDSSNIKLDFFKFWVWILWLENKIPLRVIKWILW